MAQNDKNDLQYLKSLTHGLRDRAKLQEYKNFMEADSDIDHGKIDKMLQLGPRQGGETSRPSGGSTDGSKFFSEPKKIEPFDPLNIFAQNPSELRADPSMRVRGSTPAQEPKKPFSLVPQGQTPPPWAPGQPNPPGMAVGGKDPGPAKTTVRPARTEPNTDDLKFGIPQGQFPEITGKSSVSTPGEKNVLPYVASTLAHGALAGAAALGAGGTDDPMAAAAGLKPQPAPGEPEPSTPTPFGQLEKVPYKSTVWGKKESPSDNTPPESAIPPEPQPQKQEVSDSIDRIRRLAGVQETFEKKTLEAPEDTSAADPSDDDINAIPLKSQPGVMTSPTGSAVVNPPSGAVAFTKGGGGGGEPAGGSPASDASPAPSGTPAQKPPPPPQTTKGDSEPVTVDIISSDDLPPEVQQQMTDLDKKIDAQQPAATPPEEKPDSQDAAQDEIDRIAKLAGVNPPDVPKGAATTPGPTVIADPSGYEPSTGDVNLPVKDTDKLHITGEPGIDYKKLDKPVAAQDNPVTVKPEQTKPEPTVEPPTAVKPAPSIMMTQPAPKFADLLKKATPQTIQQVTPQEIPPEPETKPVEPAKPDYSRAKPTTPFDKPVQKEPEVKPEPQQPAQAPTPPAPPSTPTRAAPTGGFNKTVPEPTPPGKPAATGNKFTPQGYELATDDPNDNRPTTWDNHGNRIIDPYITKHAVTPGGREAFAQKEFGTSAEERARRAGASGYDPRNRELNAPGKGGAGGGAGDRSGTGPGAGGDGGGKGGGQGPGTGPGKGPGQGPGEGGGRGGEWQDHNWFEIHNGRGKYLDDPGIHSQLGKDWVRVGPGNYRSRLPETDPNYKYLDLRVPKETNYGSGTRDWARSYRESIEGLRNFASTIKERAFAKETGIKEATPPANDKPQMAVSVPAGQPKPATPAPLSTDPNATKTTAAGTPVPPAQPAGPAGVVAPKPVDTSAANPSSGTSSTATSANQPEQKSGETTESINTLRRLAGLNK